MKDTYYIVYIKEEYLYKFRLSTLKNGFFCGQLVNQNNENFYFEINGSKDLVIIPHESIEWMAPSYKHKEIKKKRIEGHYVPSAYSKLKGRMEML